MKPAFAVVDQERTVSPHAQEIEYALVLQGIITAVKDDPIQMRTAIYEYARAKLKNDTAELDENERSKLLDALETAIQGVERYSLRRDEIGLLPPPDPAARIGPAKSSQVESSQGKLSSQANSSQTKSPAVVAVTPVVA